MEKDSQPQSDEPEAEIIEFPKSEIQRSMERHPAKGKKSPAEILAELGIQSTAHDNEKD